MDREREIFAECLDLTPGDRAAYLEAACGGDVALRQRLERLLAAHAMDSAGFGTRPAIPQALPETIGPYRVIGVIGEGGMGTVYEALQTEPVERRVAVKVIRMGASRFAAEAQTLALMEHPNVAKVFDAGETVLGHPYVVMELVRGEPITTFCERGKLPVRERIPLFLQLCRAVEHAHQKGLIHRDLKPSNVLVSGTGAESAVKVIDFGIAKALGAAHMTLTAAPIGTPAYMSPEQANCSPDIDTRSDVYALGVILYELIKGELPADPDAVGYARFLSQLGQGAIQVAPPRVRDTGADLDWIVLHALEPDRERRYPSASSLAEDLERYLADRPVLARRPTLRYRAGKFVRRNRLAVAGAAAAVLALIAGSTAAGIGYLRATRAEALAREEAAASAEVSRFLVETFRINDPSETRGRTVTARELLDNASKQVESSFASQPSIRQRLLTSLSAAYASLGLYGDGALLAKKAVAGLPAPGRETLQDASALLELANSLHRQNKFDDALKAADRAVAIRTRILGRNHAAVAEALVTEGNIFETKDRFDQSIRSLGEAVAIRRAALGEVHADTARALTRLSRTFTRRGQKGDKAQARDLQRHALAIYEKTLGKDHVEYAAGLDLLAFVVEDNKEALQLKLQALDVRLKTFGPEHIRVSDSYLAVAQSYYRAGDFVKARELGLKAQRLREKQFGPDSVQMNNVLHVLATAEAGLNGYAAALPLFRRYLEISRKNLGPDHTTTRQGEINVGKALMGLRRYDEALPHLREGVRGGFPLRWEDDWYDPVRKDPRFLALVEEERNLQKDKKRAELSQQVKIK